MVEIDEKIDLSGGAKKMMGSQMFSNAYSINHYSYDDFVLSYCLYELIGHKKRCRFNDNRKYYSRKVAERAKLILDNYKILYGKAENDDQWIDHICKLVKDYQKQMNGESIRFFLVYEKDDGELRIVKDPWSSRLFSMDIGNSIRKKYGFSSKELASAKLKHYQKIRNKIHFVSDPEMYMIVEIPYKDQIYV